MTVPYAGAEAIVLADVATWLAGSVAFQAFTGTADAEAAAERIVEIEGNVVSTVAHAIIDSPAIRIARTAGGAHDGTADVAIVLASPLTDGDTGAESHRRALNHLAAIRLDLLAAADQRMLSIAADPPVILDPSDGLPSWIEFSLALTLEVAP